MAQKVQQGSKLKLSTDHGSDLRQRQSSWTEGPDCFAYLFLLSACLRGKIDPATNSLTFAQVTSENIKNNSKNDDITAGETIKN